VVPLFEVAVRLAVKHSFVGVDVHELIGPGSASQHNGIAQIEFPPARGASLGIIGIQLFKVHYNNIMFLFFPLRFHSAPPFVAFINLRSPDPLSILNHLKMDFNALACLPSAAALAVRSMALLGLVVVVVTVVEAAIGDRILSHFVVSPAEFGQHRDDPSQHRLGWSRA
jgi:hypothetical protein